MTFKITFHHENRFRSGGPVAGPRSKTVTASTAADAWDQVNSLSRVYRRVEVEAPWGGPLDWRRLKRMARAELA